MKKQLCLMMAVILVLSCFTGCGRSIDNSGYAPTGDAILLDGQEPEDIEPEEEEEIIVPVPDEEEDTTPAEDDTPADDKTSPYYYKLFDGGN